MRARGVDISHFGVSIHILKNNRIIMSEKLKFAIWIAIILINHQASAKEFHEHLTDEEISLVFDTDRDSVPVYKVLPIFHEEHREHDQSGNPRVRRSVSFDLEQKNIALYLEANSNVLVGKDTPIYLSQRDHSSRQGVKYVKRDFSLPDDFLLFHDREKRAALLAYEENGVQHYMGTIGDSIIRPLPINLREKASEYLGLQTYSNLPIHVLIQKPNEVFANNNIVSPEILERASSESINDVKIVYPQILLQLSWDTYWKHGRDVEAVIKYVAAFWNSVDLIFRQMDQPKVRLNIAGIIIPQSKDACLFMQQHQYNQSLLDVTKTYLDVAKHFTELNHIFPFDTYDIAVALTTRLMVSMKNNVALGFKSGLAQLRGACLLPKYNEVHSLLSTALVMDRGFFDGLFTAAHELGHLFGSPHDGSDNNCRFNEGFIMGSQTPGIRDVMWSKCSIKAMRQYLKTADAKCLYDKPEISKPFDKLKLLPGKVLTRSLQCTRNFLSEKKRYSTVVQQMIVNRERTNSQRSCSSLICVMYHPLKTRTMIPVETSLVPLEGSNCGDGKMCIKGECEEEI